MPKYEREPGRYSHKRPRPIDRGKTAKYLLNTRELDDETLEDIKRNARRRMRKRWQDAHAEDFATLEACAECQRKLERINWQLEWDIGGANQTMEQVLEPLFEPCEQHPSIFRDWVYDLFTDMLRMVEEEYQ